MDIATLILDCGVWTSGQWYCCYGRQPSDIKGLKSDFCGVNLDCMILFAILFCLFRNPQES